MFGPTLDHQKEIRPGQARIRLGLRVPDHAVNLAYVHVPALTPPENVQIVDTSGFILENAASDRLTDILMWPDEAFLLRDASGRPDINAQSFLITNVFADGEPLYYAHRLRYCVHDPAGPDAFGFYHGTSINVVDRLGKPIGGSYRYKIHFTATSSPGVWRVIIYSNFQTTDVRGFQVTYPAVDLRSDSSRALYPDWQEALNPQVAFVRVMGMSQLDPAGASSVFYRANAAEYGRSKVYVPAIPLLDTRTPVHFEYRIVARDGTAEYATSWVALSVVAAASVLPHEATEYINGRRRITTTPARNLVREAAGSDVPESAIYQVEVRNATGDVQVGTRPDGMGLVSAKTGAKTGSAVVPSDYVVRSIGGVDYFNATYAVKLVDHRRVHLAPPIEAGPLENWYARISNGRFERDGTDATGGRVSLGYFIPEYYRQSFDPQFGMPYKKVEGEEPKTIASRRLRLRCTPLFIQVDGSNKPTNLKVLVNGIEMAVVDWDVAQGTVELSGNVRDGDKTEVTYYYEETSLVYRGFYDAERNRFWYLDLNAGPGHVSTQIDDDGEIKDLPGFRLINKTVYVYMRPAAHLKFTDHFEIIRDTFTKDTIFHTFSPIEEMTSEERGLLRADNALLLGKILVRPNASHESVQIRDVRVRGGGLKTSITKEIMQQFESESELYYDIGYYDGEPYPENAVVVIRLPKTVLKDFGGRFTRSEAEAIVEKHIGWGTLFIVEYTDHNEVVPRPEGVRATAIEIPEGGEPDA